MVSALTKRWKSPCIIHWDDFRNRIQPTDSAEEAKLYDLFEKDGPGRVAPEHGSGVRFAFLEEALRPKPNAIVIVDPLELLFTLDTGKKLPVLALYKGLRKVLSLYPKAALLITFNLRKWGKHGRQPRLLTNPREWLEEVCGTLDIVNRSDVRLGVDMHDEDVRVINGIRRAEEMSPLLIRSVTHEDQVAGFELCPPNDSALNAAFTHKQIEYWHKLLPRFRFEDIADKVVPRASLKRLLDRAKSLGLVESENGIWQKRDNR